MNMTEQRARDILGALVQQKHADEIFVLLRAASGVTQRIADNHPQPAHTASDASVQLTVRSGKRYMTVHTNDLREQALAGAVSHAASLAASMPEASGFIPFPSSTEVMQTALSSATFSPDPAALGALSGQICDRTASETLRANGSIGLTTSAMAVASSNGLFLYQDSTLFQGQLRLYTDDGWSTGFAQHYGIEMNTAPMLAALDTAVQKCRAWKNPVSIETGRLTTVFEPRALADMLQLFIQQFHARAIEEDRSFLRRLDGSSFAGTRMFDSSITLTSDPAAPQLPSMPFTADGRAVRPATWIRDGVIEDVVADASDKNAKVPTAPTNLLLAGTETDSEQLIAGTDRGLLVSGLSQPTLLDPKNCLMSASTRDGLFMIEDGRITSAVRNVVMRETPVYIFKEVEALSRPQPVSTTGSYFPMLLPHMRVKDVLYGAASGMI